MGKGENLAVGLRIWINKKFKGITNISGKSTNNKFFLLYLFFSILNLLLLIFCILSLLILIVLSNLFYIKVWPKKKGKLHRKSSKRLRREEVVNEKRIKQ